MTLTKYPPSPWHWYIASFSFNVYLSLSLSPVRVRGCWREMKGTAAVAEPARPDWFLTKVNVLFSARVMRTYLCERLARVSLISKTHTHTHHTSIMYETKHNDVKHIVSIFRCRQGRTASWPPGQMYCVTLVCVCVHFGPVHRHCITSSLALR